MKKEYNLRCSSCGRFISYNDFKLDKIITEYVPDSYYGQEEIEYFHKSCINKNATKDKT